MFTEFDVAVVIILMTTTISSMVRGAIREVLGVIALGGSAGLTLYFYPYALTLTQDHFTSAAVGSMMAVLSLFVITLIICTALAAVINASFGTAREGIADRLFGMIFGFFKGYCIVSLIHFIIFFAAGRENPEWLQSGETYNITQSGSEFLDNQLKDYILAAYDNIQDTQEENNSALGEYIDEYGEPAVEDLNQMLDQLPE